MMEVPETIPEPIGFAPCGTCGRTFNPDVLVRHERICTKNKQSKRTAFDSTKQRYRDFDYETLQLIKKAQASKPSKGKSPFVTPQSDKKADWRRKHEELVQSVRAARDITEAIKTGAPLPPHKPSAPNPDHIQCPYCNRRFQESAAEKHVPFCKEKSSRINARKPSSKAQDSLNRRTQYKPPLPRKKSSVAGNNSERVAPSNPPGSSVVSRNTNFSATYTLSGEDGSPSSTRGPRGPRGANISGVGSQRSSSGTGRVRGPIKTSIGGASSRNLPGSTPTTHKQRAPNREGVVEMGAHISRQTSFSKSNSAKEGAPGVRQQLRTRSPLTSPIHHLSETKTIGTSSRPSSYRNDSSRSGSRGVIIQQPASRSYYDTPPHEYSDKGAAVHVKVNGSLNRNKRLASIGVSEQSSSSEDERLTQPSVNTRKGSSKRDGSTSSHHRHDAAVPRLNSLERVNSETSTGSVHSAGRGRVPLNAHGMPMSKFCYECGTKFPVPQAKYCCECGTKRL